MYLFSVCVMANYFMVVLICQPNWQFSFWPFQLNISLISYLTKCLNEEILRPNNEPTSKTNANKQAISVDCEYIMNDRSQFVIPLNVLTQKKLPYVNYIPQLTQFYHHVASSVHFIILNVWLLINAFNIIYYSVDSISTHMRE